ncbi:DUF5668 domain-containing protein [bacterium BMS3Abin03]|nr:DUF5668 domain-containing protein [bacterium BMS3Abin03]MCG6960516.1 DUF5668 domain-containing protein [bacterium BMS3Abin03]
MKTSHIFWGTLFIVLGLLILLNNFSPIGLYWEDLWQYWPIVLVLLGISLMIRNRGGKIIFAASAAIFLAVSIFASVKFTTGFINNDFEVSFDDNGHNNYTVNEYKEDYDPAINRAILNLDAKAGDFNIDSVSKELIYIKTVGTDNKFYLTKNEYDGTSNLRFRMKKTRFHFGKGNYKNKVNISMNENPVWNLNLDIGAASIDMDLTKYKIEKLDVDMGAASLDVKLGALSDKTNVIVDAGASSINISVPEQVGCEIKTDDVLSSNSYDNFRKIKSGLYRTSNFDDVQKKIYIDIDCGVSSVSINRYKMEY